MTQILSHNSHDLLPMQIVPVIASFNDDGQIKPLYVGINGERYKVSSSVRYAPKKLSLKQSYPSGSNHPHGRILHSIDSSGNSGCRSSHDDRKIPDRKILTDTVTHPSYFLFLHPTAPLHRPSVRLTSGMPQFLYTYTHKSCSSCRDGRCNPPDQTVFPPAARKCSSNLHRLHPSDTRNVPAGPWAPRSPESA